jgi:hypothetical protein
MDNWNKPVLQEIINNIFGKKNPIIAEPLNPVQ